MLEIKNLKTEVTQQQIDSKWVEVLAKRKQLLKESDWTQLTDINIVKECDVDIKDWRNKLRKIDLKSAFVTPEQASEFLEEHKNSFPDIVFADTPIESPSPEPNTIEEELRSFKSEILEDLTKPNLENKLAAMHDEVDEKIVIAVESIKSYVDEKIEKILQQHSVEEVFDIIFISKEEAHELLIKSYKKDKNETLLDLDALEYVIFEAKLDQASDYLVQDDPSLDDYSLLSNNNGKTDLEYVQGVVSDCKQYFKNIMRVEEEYLQLEKSLYNMSVEELNQELEKYGHRYRCRNKSLPSRYI